MSRRGSTPTLVAEASPRYSVWFTSALSTRLSTLNAEYPLTKFPSLHPLAVVERVLTFKRQTGERTAGQRICCARSPSRKRHAVARSPVQPKASLCPRKATAMLEIYGVVNRDVFEIRCKKCKSEMQCRYVGVLRRPGPTFLAFCPRCGTEQHFRLSQWTGLATDADRS